MKPADKTNTRRKFIGKSLTAATGIALATQSGFAFPAIISDFRRKEHLFEGVQLGTITYSFRAMPDQSAEATLQYVKDCDIHAIELMGDPAETFAGRPDAPMSRAEMFRVYRMSRNENITEDQKKEVAEVREQMEAYGREVSEWRASVSSEKFIKMKEMYNDAGVQIYAFKPNAFGINSPDSDINYGMKAAKALGATHITLEIPGNDAHTQKLGDMASKYGLLVGYHGHEQQTPTIWDTALSQSPANALNIDIGHYTAAGHTDTIELLTAKHDRIASMHVKDRRNPENGKANMPWGDGDTPIIEALLLMRDNGYTFPATIEMEYEVPEGSDAVEEVRKCAEYCRNALGA